MITSKAIYNLSKTSKHIKLKFGFNYIKAIKRKIPFIKISCVTVSKMSSEFVLHCPEEYDYRYSSADKS